MRNVTISKRDMGIDDPAVDGTGGEARSTPWARPRMRRTLHVRKLSAKGAADGDAGGVKPERGGRMGRPPRQMMKEKASTPQSEERETDTAATAGEPTAGPEVQDIEWRSHGGRAERSHSQGVDTGRCIKAEGIAGMNHVNAMDQAGTGVRKGRVMPGLANAVDQAGTGDMRGIVMPENRRRSGKAEFGKTRRRMARQEKRGAKANQR